MHVVKPGVLSRRISQLWSTTDIRGGTVEIYKVRKREEERQSGREIKRETDRQTERRRERERETDKQKQLSKQSKQVYKNLNT